MYEIKTAMAKNRIKDHTLKVLEFAAVLETLGGFALSELGREAALKLTPSLDARWIRLRQAETTEMRRLLETGRRVPMGGIRDIRKLMERCAGGFILECAELLAVASTLEASDHLREFFDKLEVPAAALRQMAQRLGNYEQLAGAINRCVENEERLRDAASPKLAELRREIAILEEHVRSRFKHILQSTQLREAIENDNLLFRQGRPVIAVKLNYRSWIRGKILDRSKSGMTVYVEPAELAESSSELEEMVYEEQKEVGRILWELTHAVFGRREEILQTVETLGRLDMTYAKARMSLFHRQNACEITEDGVMRLRGARHPLLVEMAAGKIIGPVETPGPREPGYDYEPGDSEDTAGEKSPVELEARPVRPRAFGDGVAAVTPIDVELGGRFDLLLLTGPNTGGKTVTLKTIGLAALMGQSGMHINAEEGSSLAICRQVFADIGDEQSLQQSLSTFSAHMKQMVGILQGADKHSLVLLDEIGAGTDPAEGAALGAAILETLLAQGAKIAATTHLGALKQFAYNCDRAENGSVEFDPETFAPTYRLRIGEPGTSNALAITKRLGMPKAVVKRARTLLGEDAAQEVDLLRKAQSFRRAAQQEKEQTAMLHQEAQRIKVQAEEMREAAKAERGEIRGEADAYVDETLQQVRLAVRHFMRQMGEAPGPWRQTAVALWGEVEKIAARTTVGKRRTEFIKGLRTGDYVYLTKFGRQAMVLRIQRKKETLTVTMDGRELEVHYEQVAVPK